jgi:hypothetical protein
MRYEGEEIGVDHVEHQKPVSAEFATILACNRKSDEYSPGYRKI